VPAERLVSQGWGWTASRVRAATGSASGGVGVGREDVVVGHLANNSREKGTVDLLMAAEGAWRSGGRFHVVLAGPEMPNFQRFWTTYGPAGRVRRLGVLDDKGKRDFFAGLDVSRCLADGTLSGSFYSKPGRTGRRTSPTGRAVPRGDPA